MMWYQGDLALARAAATAGLPFTISSASTMNLEEIAVAGGRLWFQLYLWEDRSLSHAVVQRAHEQGCEALFVTLDMPVPPNREYIHHNGFGTPFRLNARNTIDCLTHPRWLLGVMGRYSLNGGIPSQANLPNQLRAKVTKRRGTEHCSSKTISTGTGSRTCAIAGPASSCSRVSCIPRMRSGRWRWARTAWWCPTTAAGRSIPRWRRSTHCPRSLRRSAAR
jgi:isopentenyl diphosphate isomerase/L-lactate dehydrogenase-like FMN-dependent dehydrogenase